MTRFILIAVALIFIYFLMKLIRLMKQFSSASKATIDDQKKNHDDIDKHFRDIEEAKYREIPDDEGNINKDKNSPPKTDG